MIISGLQMIMMTVQLTSTLPKLPKHGHATCTKFSATQDTADSHVMAQFYLAIVQSRLLYGSERPTWVLSQHTLTWFKSFHNWCTHAIAHCPIHECTDSTCLGASLHWQSFGFLWIVRYLDIYYMVQDKAAQSICQSNLRAHCIACVRTPLH
jgi:hypothetical protein